MALTATIFVTVAFIVSEIGEGEEQLSYNTSKIESVLNMWKKNKWPFLSTALMLRCLVLILSGARSKHRALLCHHNLDNEALCLDVIFSVKSIQNLSRKKNTDDVSAVYFTQFILRLMRCLLLSTQELWKGAPYQVIFFHDHLSLSPSNYNY